MLGPARSALPLSLAAVLPFAPAEPARADGHWSGPGRPGAES